MKNSALVRFFLFAPLALSATTGSVAYAEDKKNAEYDVLSIKKNIIVTEQVNSEKYDADFTGSSLDFYDNNNEKLYSHSSIGSGGITHNVTTEDLKDPKTSHSSSLIIDQVQETDDKGAPISPSYINLSIEDSTDEKPVRTLDLNGEALTLINNYDNVRQDSYAHEVTFAKYDDKGELTNGSVLGHDALIIGNYVNDRASALSSESLVMRDDEKGIIVNRNGIQFSKKVLKEGGNKDEEDDFNFVADDDAVRITKDDITVGGVKITSKGIEVPVLKKGGKDGEVATDENGKVKTQTIYEAIKDLSADLPTYTPSAELTTKVDGLEAKVIKSEQLAGRVDKNSADIYSLDKKLKQGMAKQAALNGLFQPYNVGKFSTTAALGGYESDVAVAVGAGYRFNEHLATKGGVAFGSSDKSTSYNIGVNYEW